VLPDVEYQSGLERLVNDANQSEQQVRRIAALEAERDALKAKYEKLDHDTTAIQTAYGFRHSSDESTFEEYCDNLSTLPEAIQHEWSNQDALRKERDDARRNEDYHYAQASKYSRYAECLQNALRKIEAVQYEGYGAGDDWKSIREIINAIPHIDEV
jgi:hypothetical protein